MLKNQKDNKNVHKLMLYTLIICIFTKFTESKNNLPVENIKERNLEPAQRNLGRNSLDILKGLENDDFMGGFGGADLGFDNKNFWKSFNNEFTGQNMNMRNHINRIQNNMNRMKSRLRQNISNEKNNVKNQIAREQDDMRDEFSAIQNHIRNIRRKRRNRRRGHHPTSKTIIYTDKNGNKIIQKSSHDSNNFRTKNGVEYISSDSSSINTVSPGGSMISINSGGNGIMVSGNKVIEIPSKKSNQQNLSTNVNDFQRFYGPLSVGGSSVTQSPFE